jgi:putative transposase
VLARDFVAGKPNEKWATDITYIWTAEGWLYLAVVMDLYSRRIVGWSTSEHMETSLCLDALSMAIKSRTNVKGTTHHSDRGVQYASREYRRRLKSKEIEYIEVFYNRIRRHSTVGNISPAKFEETNQADAA